MFRHLGEMLAMLCAHPKPDEFNGRASASAGLRRRGAPAVAEHFTARFGVRTLEGYGLTETNTVLCGDLDEHRAGALGEPLPHVQVPR